MIKLLIKAVFNPRSVSRDSPDREISGDEHPIEIKSKKDFEIEEQTTLVTFKDDVNLSWQRAIFKTVKKRINIWSDTVFKDKIKPHTETFVKITSGKSYGKVIKTDDLHIIEYVWRGRNAVMLQDKSNKSRLITWSVVK